MEEVLTAIRDGEQDVHSEHRSRAATEVQQIEALEWGQYSMLRILFYRII